MNNNQRLGRFRYVFGVPFLVMGVWVFFGSILAPDRVRFTSESGAVAPPWLSALFGICFLAAGLFALKVDALTASGDGAGLSRWGALLCAVVGVAICGAGLGGGDPRDMPMGRWPVVVAGGIFLFGGAAVWMGSLSPRSPIRRAGENLAAAALLTLFGILLTGLALSPRLPEGGTVFVVGIPMPSPRWLDRALLGLVALLVDALALLAWVGVLVKKPRSADA